MKRLITLLLFLSPILLFAQYPTFSNKQKLGVQTTGDGLIFRGNQETPNYTPNNTNNAYFYLDTLTNRLKFYNSGSWQQVYPTTFDTTSLGNFLLKSDTLAMLLPYLRKSDTISLSNRINNKLNITDTVSLSNRINLKLNKTDTISLSNRINNKLNLSDTVSLSNRINTKLDTLYVNYQTNVDTIVNKDTINITTLDAGLGINITNNIISLDTILLDSIVSIKNVYVKNGTGTILNKGEAVYVTGADGTNIIVGRASNIAESSSSKTLGLTMTSIPVNGFGYVVKEGLLEGLNTNSANAGDPVWLSNIPGGLIFGLNNKPYAPNHLVYLGIVTRKQQNNGEIYVTIQNGFEIKELHDVQITNLVDNASLYYKSSEQLWRDTTAALLVSDTTSMLSKYVNTYGNQDSIKGEKGLINNLNLPSYNLGTFTSEKSFNVNFNNDANQKVRLYFPSGARLQGGYEITLSSGFYFVQASGMLRKTFGLQLQETGVSYFQSNYVPFVLGAIGNTFTISDFEYDSSTSTWGVIISCLNNNSANNVHINIKSYINPEFNDTWYKARASSAIISNIYTTNTTIYPKLNPSNLLKSDTASMLSKYVNTYGNQTNINGNKTFNNVVTIDSATVSGKLLVNTNISDAVKINTNTISTNLELMNSGGSVYIKSGNKNMTLQTDTTALVYLKGDVNKVGILTMTPQQALEVNGNVRITGLNNNLVPLKVIGSDNNGDLTNVNLGQGLSFTNDTLKVDLTIIDTAIAASAIVLTGHVTGTGNTNSSVNTTISNNVVTNNMLTGGISNDKLDNITATGKVANSATTATNLNTNNTIVSRDASGNFSAGSITATNFFGNASTATNSTNTTNVLNYLNSNEFFKFKSGNAINATGQIIVTTPNVDFSIARSDAAQTFTGTQTFSSTINGSITGNAGSVTDGVYTSRSISTTSPLQGGGDLSANRTLSILQANTSTSGFLSNTDWNTFNNKLSTATAASTYLPLTGGTLTGLLSTNTTNHPIGVNINNNYASFSEGIGLKVNQTSIGYSGRNIGITSDATVVYNYGIGIKGTATHQDMNGLGIAYGVYGNVIANSTSNGANGTTYAGYFTNDATVDGNNYGLFVNTSNKGDYGIYQQGTGVNYFQSNTSIGGTLGVTGATTLTNTTTNGTLAVNGLLNSYGKNTYTPFNVGVGEASINNVGSYLRGGTVMIFPDSSLVNSSANLFLANSSIQGVEYSAFGSGLRNYAKQGGDNRRNSLALYTSDISAQNTNRLYVNYNGDIGINDDTPSYKLDVNGTLGVTGTTTLTGALNGTTGTFTGLNVVNGSTEGIFTLQGYDNNTPTRIQFKTTGEIRRQIVLPTSDSNLEFRTSTVGGTQGGYSFYTRRNPNAEQLAFNIDYNKDVQMYGALSVTGATTLTGALTVNNATVLNENSGDNDTRIESDGNANMVFVDASTDRVGIGTSSPSKTLDVNGEVKIATTTATPTSLLGKDASNVVGEVTTVAQTGLFTRGSTNVTTGSPSATFIVTHGLGVNPTAVIVTSAGIGGSEKIIYEVYAKSSTTFSVQAWNYDGTEAANKNVTIYWFAIK